MNDQHKERRKKERKKKEENIAIIISYQL